jgi:hypothetical protein
MTERGWLECTHPERLLYYLQNLCERVSERKLRLFGCGCCRRVWHLLKEERHRRAIEIVEQYADGHLTDEDLESARVEVSFPAEDDIWATGAVDSLTAPSTDPHLKRVATYTTAALADQTDPYILLEYDEDDERKLQCSLLRDIFGDPFRPQPAIDSSWLSWNDAIVPKLAQAIYDDRAFDRLPILADALEEAGCTNADILNHCRQPGEHVRGCWVVDLLLGKS